MKHAGTLSARAGVSRVLAHVSAVERRALAAVAVVRAQPRACLECAEDPFDVLHLFIRVCPSLVSLAARLLLVLSRVSFSCLSVRVRAWAWGGVGMGEHIGCLCCEAYLSAVERARVALNIEIIVSHILRHHY